MVAAGTVTVEQAGDLLDALGSPGQPPPRPASDLGAFLGELLTRNLGRHFGEGPVFSGPPRPPRPSRPPRPHRGPRFGVSSATSRNGLSFEDLVELKTEGVPKDYIGAMSDLVPDISLGQLLECHEAGLEPAYAEAMVLALGEADIAQLLEIHEAGVERDYAEAMASVFGEVDIAQLVEMHEAGVEPDFAAALRSEFPDLEPAAIIEAAEEGVDAEDIDFFQMRGARARVREAGDDIPPDPRAAGGQGSMRA